MEVGSIVNTLAAVLAGWVIMSFAIIPAAWQGLRFLGLRPLVSVALVFPILGFLIVSYYVAYSAWPCDPR